MGGGVKIESANTLRPVLQREMLNFKCKIDPVTVHDSYSAWREDEHDDLVLSAALAAWYGEHAPKKVTFVVPTTPVMGRPMLPGSY